ncbi:MAG: nicotinate (nicotinamide) nucleotide adenylyltransferase [Anaerolineales bacterium]|nr:nicotinate (nicotinamide) nucleotide adenylyltransferase [Anaerolineales bacterium]
MRLGIFGGTFDPPHIGHLILAAEARYQLNLQRVLWVLTPTPPHKSPDQISPLQQRRQLVEAVIATDPAFALSTVDIDRPPPHYALDTVRFLGEQYPAAELVYLMGGDSLVDLPEWHQPQAFVQACHQIGVMRRPGEHIDLDQLGGQIPALRGKVQWVDAPLLEIAASEIRARRRAGRPYRYFLPESVYHLIEEMRYYSA